MKAAASLSFSSPWVQASASASYGSPSNSMTDGNKTGTSERTSPSAKPDASVQSGKTKVVAPVKAETTVQPGRGVSPVKPETPKPAVTKKPGTTTLKVEIVKSKVSVSLREGSRYLSTTKEQGVACKWNFV